MSFLQSLILGIIQGLTEFLPISSSAHLVLVPFLLGWKFPESQVFPFDVLVQLGTLIAVIIYFWTDLWAIVKGFFRGLIQRKPFEDPDARLGWYLILASIPAALAGILLKSQVEAAFNSPKVTAYFLFVTAALLLLADFFSRRNRKLDGIKWIDALWIGLFQAISIFPGISRSGSTITGGMTRHFDRPSAARFSFLMSIPIMLGAGAVSILDLFEVPGLKSFLPVLAVGFIAAILVGYLSIHWLLSFLNKHSFVWFAAYCVLLAAAVLIVSGIRGTNSLVNEIPAQFMTDSSTPISVDSNTTIIMVDQTASLDWLTPAMTTCINAAGNNSYVFHTVPGDQGLAPGSGILLRWGEPATLGSYSVVLGYESLALIVNPENPLGEITKELVQDLSSGSIKTWMDVYTKCPECFTSEPSGELLSSAPELFFYPSTDETQNHFEKTIMQNAPVASSIGILTPSPTAMRHSVSESPAAFGFVPGRALDDSVKTIRVIDLESTELSFPVLAIASTEPSGSQVAWLGCLQETLN